MKVLIRGAGDLATGIAHRLKRSGFSIVMTDIKIPTTVRRTVAFSRAIYEKEAEVEGIKGVLVKEYKEIERVVQKGEIPVLVDENADCIKWWQPDVVVDAIIAKKNIGTKLTDAEIVIGVGPGFTAGEDCHRVIETKRGHYLGKVIETGSAIPNTGVPGNIGGYTTERIIRATADGAFSPLVSIGAYVKAGQAVAVSGGQTVTALMTGIVRGMLQEGVPVKAGMKCGDIDARCEQDHCFTISDKARAIGGGVLEAVLSLSNAGLD